jgi:hypothetical protein
MTSAVATPAAVSPADTFSFMDARTATGLALGCRGWNEDAAAPLNPATTDSGAATAAMARIKESSRIR